VAAGGEVAGRERGRPVVPAVVAGTAGQAGARGVAGMACSGGGATGEEETGGSGRGRAVPPAGPGRNLRPRYRSGYRRDAPIP